MATAYVLINCEPGSDDFVVSELKAIDSVKAANGTFGTFDVIAKIEDDSEERLNNVITKQIRKLEKIRSTLTLYAVGSKDHFFDKMPIDKGSLEVWNGYMKAWTQLALLQIETSTNFVRAYVEARKLAIDSYDNYMHLWMDSYAKALSQFNSFMDKSTRETK